MSRRFAVSIRIVLSEDGRSNDTGTSKISPNAGNIAAIAFAKLPNKIPFLRLQ